MRLFAVISDCDTQRRLLTDAPTRLAAPKYVLPFSLIVQTASRAKASCQPLVFDIHRGELVRIANDFARQYRRARELTWRGSQPSSYVWASSTKP